MTGEPHIGPDIFFFILGEIHMVPNIGKYKCFSPPNHSGKEVT